VFAFTASMEPKPMIARSDLRSTTLAPPLPEQVSSGIRQSDLLGISGDLYGEGFGFSRLFDRRVIGAVRDLGGARVAPDTAHKDAERKDGNSYLHSLYGGS